MREVIMKLTPKEFEDGEYAEIVQELVRCGECKHHMDIDGMRQRHYMCGQVGCDSWFCADGERREEWD